MKKRTERRKSSRQLARYLRRRKIRRKRLHKARGVPGKRVYPPVRWELVRNTSDTVAYFLNTEAMRSRLLCHSLRSVKTLDLGAALLLRSQMRGHASGKLPMSTTMPPHRLLKFIGSCGLFNEVQWATRTGNAPPPVQKAMRALSARRIDVRRRGRAPVTDGNEVRPDLGEEIRGWILDALSLRRGGLKKWQELRLRALQTALLETMCNTASHAGQVPWTLIANVDRDRRTAVVAILDFGHGILGTQPRERRDRFQNDALLLQQVMTGLTEGGAVRSSTGQAKRGLGLPRIREDCQRGKVSELFVLANSAYADVRQDRYSLLPDGLAFPGTFICWELRLGQP